MHSPPSTAVPEAQPQSLTTPHSQDPAAEGIVVARKIPFPIFRVLLISIFAAGMSIFHLFVDFQGLSTAEGMEQADVARTLANGGGLKTKTLRPIALGYLVKKSGDANDVKIPKQIAATASGPLNPLVNSALLKLSGTDFDVDFQYRIYFPDRVIAAGAMLFFFSALGLTFWLVSRIFDAKLAGFTVVTMLVCEMMWRFTQSGLPQMLGLFLFTAALCFLYRAIELWRVGGLPLFPLISSGLLFGLLVLAAPIGLGVAIAAAFFVALTFKKRVLCPVFFSLMMVIVCSPWMMGNLSKTGSLLGTGTAEIQDSWGESAGSPVMRNFSPTGEAAAPRFFLARKMGRVLEQHFQNFFLLIGGSIGAAFFVLSLLQPFNNPNARTLRNGLAMMWAGALFGMMMFGTPDLLIDSNQVHLWFVPVATAFGYAILSIFWARLPIAQDKWSLWQNTHLIGAVILTALPMIVNMPGRAVLGFNFSNRVVNWPPYDPAAIAYLKKWTRPDQVIFSDVPWAVSWYADRTAVWIPKTPTQFQKIAEDWEESDPETVAGIFLTPQTLDQKLSSGLLYGDYQEWNRVLMAGPMKSLEVDVYSKRPVAMRHATRLAASKNHESWFFSPRPVREQNEDAPKVARAVDSSDQ